MKPQKVSLELKLSKEITDGAWRGLCLGSEAMLEPDETLAQGTERLYEELAAEFKLVWGRETKSLKATEEPSVPTIPMPPTPSEEEPIEDPSWCPIHEDDMQLHTKGSQSWYSHKLKDGAWCNGKPQEKKPDPSYCPIHKVTMAEHEKAGETWYAHKVGVWWCHGKEQKGAR